MNPYDQLLKLFKGDKNASAPYFHNPCLSSIGVVSTDGNALAIVDQIHVEGEYQALDSIQDAKITAVIPQPNRVTVIPIQVLEEALAGLTLVEEVLSGGDQETCNACYGEGQVEFIFEYDSNSFSSEADCPVCDGNGTVGLAKPTGRYVPDLELYIKLGACAFSGIQLDRLYRAAKLIGAEEIMMMHQMDKPTSVSLFRLSSGVRIAIMPCYPAENVFAHMSW